MSGAAPVSGVKPYSEDTKKLQAELNQHIELRHLPGPKIREDGKEGPVTRAKLQELQAYLKAQPSEPRAEAVPAKRTPTDRLETKNPTIGEYVDDQVKKFGQELKEDAQVIAVTAVAAPLVGLIEARHLNQARERIAKLPMDAAGQWKQTAKTILAEEQAAAKQEIIGLPGKLKDSGANAAQAVADRVSDTASGLKSAALYVAEDVRRDVARTAQSVADGYKAVESKVDEAIDNVQDAASGLKSAALYVAEDVRGDIQRTRQDLGGVFSRVGKWISGD
jgi:uncharacterized phage infection (PIP) family protein YhgE